MTVLIPAHQMFQVPVRRIVDLEVKIENINQNTKRNTENPEIKGIEKTVHESFTSADKYVGN